MLMTGVYLSLFFTAFLLSLLLTRLGIYLSFKWGILDVPLTLVRKNHSKSTPLLGGSAVFFFLLSFGLYLLGNCLGT